VKVCQLESSSNLAIQSFRGVRFYIHYDIEHKRKAIELRRILSVRLVTHNVPYKRLIEQEHGGIFRHEFVYTGVILVFLDAPQQHLTVPVSDVDHNPGVPYTNDEVFQHFAARTNPGRDQAPNHRRQVVQAEWVQECLIQEKQLRFDGWEIK
jgi:hypothetical protein